MPYAIEGIAWTRDGIETVPEDPSALSGYPSVEQAYEAFATLTDIRGDGFVPTELDWRRMLAVGAVAWGAGLRGEDPYGPQARARLDRLADLWRRQDEKRAASMADRASAGIDGVAWTHEGLEVALDDPAAMPGYPGPGFVDRVRLLLAEEQMLGAMPTEEQLRWGLGLFAISEGCTRRGDDPAIREFQERVMRFEEAWEEREHAIWPDRLQETPEQREARHQAIARWRAGEGD